MTKPSTSPPAPARDLPGGSVAVGERVPLRRPGRSARKASKGGVPQPQPAGPDRMEWADPLTGDEKRALEAGWKFVG